VTPGRIAVISDVHGNLPALEAVAGDLRRLGVERVLNLGDSLSGPLWPAETARFLMDRAWPSLAGNHERQLLACGRRRGGPSDQFAFEAVSRDVLDWVAAMPRTARLDGGVFACHGTPFADDTYLLETADRAAAGGIRAATAGEIEARASGVAEPLVLCGHSHVPRVVEAGGRVVVNPGSVGLPAYEDDGDSPHVVQTGSPHARYAIVDFGTSAPAVALRAVAYPWRDAVARARANGRDDYVRWLSGWA
jgi:predicted phosphodiesterase